MGGKIYTIDTGGSVMDCEMFLITLGDNIEMIRKMKGVSKKQLVDDIGYDRQDMTRLELGKQDAMLSTIVKIAKYLDISLPQLFVRELKLTDILPYVQNDFHDIFIENLKRRKKISNLTEKAISEMAEIDIGTVHRILNSTIKDSRMSTLYVISKCVDSNMERMFRRMEETE